ncbi:hypothetical protein JTE90_002891 [Oedothorax gibbosus]|uniref:RNA-dependent RNA polymerase n=1 Tax=Oedothorax gibbosus TaxID=931172 RepID=A0AAV6VCK3_9ARAC|nr:hypothetical protein JTE90_002891 [Oedothorax gibbosus]
MSTKSIRFVVTYKKSVTDSPSSVEEGIKLFFTKFYHAKKGDCEISVIEPRNIDVDQIYKAELYEIDIIIKFTNCADNFQPGNEFKEIGSAWCDPSKNSLSHLWLRLGNRQDIQNNSKPSHSDVDVKEIAFGTFPTMQNFMEHYRYEGATTRKMQELMSTFYHNQRFFVVYTCLNHKVTPNFKCNNSGKTHKFVVYYKSISRVIVYYIPDQDAVELYFVVRYLPFVYNEKKGRNNEEIKGNPNKGNILASDQEYQEKRWERSLIFGCRCNNSYCHIDDVGKCPVFKVVLTRKTRAFGIIERLIQRCAANTFFFCSNISVSHPDPRMSLDNFGKYPGYDWGSLNMQAEPKEKLDAIFSCQFAWEVVNSRSLEIRDQIIMKCQQSGGLDHWKFIKEVFQKCYKFNEAICNTLYHISELVLRCEIFTFEDALLKIFENYKRNPPKSDLPDGMCFVRRLIITPSRLICLPPTEHFDNRVIREFGSDHLLRVSIQDDNFSKLTFAVQYHTQKDDFMDQVVREILNRNIVFGPRVYEFLASSNSQLREHGLWMFAKDTEKNITAEKIRNWMGDFKGIRNVAKYMARMGQCFSSSEEAAQIELGEEDVEEWPDIKTLDQKYTFSDGIGMISTELAKEIRKALEQKMPFQINGNFNRYKPTAFQIRFQGCKGMVAVNPQLKGRKLIIRPSMNKFPCNSSNLLEIVKISAARNLFLNRPLITILEQLGVKSNIFMKLQKDMVLELTDSLIYEMKAWKLMSNLTTLDYPYKRLLNAGICLTEEPFFRSLLLAVYKVAIDLLRSKARIAIPPQFGRNMLGVLDETDSLEYGQIFVQYSEELGSAESETHILERTVVVTKNPCMHPGDVRKLQAVDVKALHHLKDCIVFPAKGKRPHPDEMAGSDLDGDEYVVIWYDDLIFPDVNKVPMDYPENPAKLQSKPITVPDMIDFLCTYIQNDNIGVLANAHLAWADYHVDGIFSKVCMSIAKKYPQVLDFAKSGFTCYLKAEEKPKFYPDFMEKGTSQNSYKSQNVLGMLFRVTKNLEACVSRIDVTSHAETDDPHFEYPGWEEYKDEAENSLNHYNKRVKNILKKYGLHSETEALTGYVGKMNEYTENRHERDNALSIARTYILDAMKRSKFSFFRAYDFHSRSKHMSPSDLQELKYKMASAWYMVTYRSLDNPVLSFPWIVHDLLCEIREKKLRMRDIVASRPKSSFIKKSDARLVRESAYQSLLNGKCCCVMILYNTVQGWMTQSDLNKTMSADNTFCSYCFARLLSLFVDADRKNKCCSFKPSHMMCDCKKMCSPTKLILEFMKFYATELRSSVSSCGAFIDSITPNTTGSATCNGIREMHLQSIALRTYASLAITRDPYYLGLNENPMGTTDDNSYEEGDPIRISVSQDFEYLLSHKGDDLKLELIELTGVRNVYIIPDKDPKGNWYVLVQSIGTGLQRQVLEELVMDENIVSIISNRLNMKENRRSI